MPLCVFVCVCVRLRKRVCEQMSEVGGGGVGVGERVGER